LADYGLWVDYDYLCSVFTLVFEAIKWKQRGPRAGAHRRADNLRGIVAGRVKTRERPNIETVLK
jgi:hypothetical protein